MKLYCTLYRKTANGHLKVVGPTQIQLATLTDTGLRVDPSWIVSTGGHLELVHGVSRTLGGPERLTTVNYSSRISRGDAITVLQWLDVSL